jgi:hypothetical protein
MPARVAAVAFWFAKGVINWNVHVSDDDGCPVVVDGTVVLVTPTRLPTVIPALVTLAAASLKLVPNGVFTVTKNEASAGCKVPGWVAVTVTELVVVGPIWACSSAEEKIAAAIRPQAELRTGITVFIEAS